MSDDILVDHILEAYSPAEGEGDRERLRAGVEALIEAHERDEVVDDEGEP